MENISFYCDGCDETLIDGVSWREAVETVKQNDWKFEKVDGEWEHYSPYLVSGGSSVWAEKEKSEKGREK